MEKNKIAKITMSLEAESLLNQMVTKTNDGFTGGKVSKHDLLSWIVTCFSENYFERNIDRVQQDHFDRLVHIARCSFHRDLYPQSRSPMV